MKVTISPRNEKIGRTPNISLPPLISCKENVPCFDLCYARKFYKWFKVRKAWDGNFEAYTANPAFYFNEIDKYLGKHSPEYFRWHVGGDIVDDQYFDYMLTMANWHPGIKFLAYTKRYDLVDYTWQGIPKNLSVMLSIWPYWDVPKIPLPKFWIQSDLRCPDNAFKCPGQCDSCRYCWNEYKDVKVRLH